MAEKLTPRVGDRVIARKGPGSPHRTLAGTVKAIDADHVWVVRDGHMDAFGYDLCAIEVVDREPVEWPKGWTRSSVYPGCASNGAHVYERYELEAILATGPEMLAKWSELMDES